MENCGGRVMGNITDAVLAAALKELMVSQMLERQSYDEIPPRVEYRLTERITRELWSTGKNVITVWTVANDSKGKC